ncbi:MAG: restriction endonuclease subunit S [Clostridium sp.]
MSAIYKKLEEVCEILDSRRVPITAKNRKTGIYPYYGANGLQDYVAEYIFDDELVLLAEDGGNFGSKERPIAYRVSGKCWVNNHAHVLKAKPLVNADYLCYALMFYDTEGLVNGATRQKLTQTAMRQMMIPYRNMTEQLQIADEINQVIRLIDKRKEELSLLDQLVKSRFIEMFGDPEKNPFGWDMSTIGVLISSCEAGWSGNGSQREKKDGEIAVLKVSAVTKGYFIPDECKVLDDQSNIKKYVFPQEGDLLFSRANTREMVGATAVITQNYPEYILPDKLWRIRFVDATNVWYMKYILSSKSIRAIFASVSTGTSGSMFNVSMEKFKSIAVPLPPLELQEQFAVFVTQTDKSKYLFYCLEYIRNNFNAMLEFYMGG